MASGKSMADVASRRDFFRTLLAACGCSLPGAFAAGQQFPADNSFQARLSHLYARRDGQLRQILLVETPPGWSDARLETCIGKTSEMVHLSQVQNIHGQYYVPITPVEQKETARLVLQGPDKTLETYVQVHPTRRWEVYIVHNSHQDPGFLDLPSVMRARFIPSIDAAMDYCRQTDSWPADSQFKWNIESSYLVEDYQKVRDKQKLLQLMDWIKKGRVTIGATYCSAATDLMSLETLHRLVYYGAERLEREFGIHLRGAFLDDVSGFTWALVEVLAKAGIRYLVFGANGERDNMQNGNAPILFYLQGPAGSEILIWRPLHYGEGIDLVTFVDPYSGRTHPGVNLGDGEETIAPYFERYESADYPFDQILLQAAHDFAVPYKEFSEVVRTWNTLWAFPHLRLSTLAEFFEHLETHHRDQIPRLRGGVPDAWVDLHNAEALSASLARRTEDALPDTEKLSTLAHLLTGAPGRQNEFFDAYNELILMEEHTVQMYRNADIYVDERQGGGKRHWEEKVAHVEFAHREAERIRTESLRALCGNFPAARSGCLAVWNPLSWVRNEIARTSLPETTPSPFRLVDLTTGKEVPYQIERQESGPQTLVFQAADVPALGYRLYGLERGNPAATGSQAPGSQTSLENSFYRISLSEKDGTVTSLFDKQLQREFADPTAEHGLNALVYLLNERLNERDYTTLAHLPVQDVTLQAGSNGPVYASLKVTGHIGYLCQWEHEVILYRCLQRVDFYNRLRKKPGYAKESVYYAFPFNVRAERPRVLDYFDHFNTYRIDMPGSIMQPDIDQIPGSSRDNYVSQHWVSISRRDYGVLWSSADAPLVELGGIQTDKYLPSLTMQDMNWLKEARLYSFLMNNHWTVNAPIAQGGDYLFRYAVTTHGSNWDYNSAHQFGWSFMSPLRVLDVEGKPQGNWLDPAHSFLGIVPENVYLTGFKVAEDGGGAILRLYEGAGLDSPTVVRFRLPGRKLISAVDCDACERNLSGLEADATSVHLWLRPFEIRTVRVRFA